MELLISEKITKKLQSFSEAKYTEPCIILYNESILKMPSGKSAWRNKGDAKRALTNAFYGTLSYNEKRAIQDEYKGSVADYLENENIVKFVIYDSTEMEKLKAKLEKQTEDLYWLQCLNMAGVDNWEGTEYAQEMFEEKYPEENN
jgi:hypothetical protein